MSAVYSARSARYISTALLLVSSVSICVAATPSWQSPYVGVYLGGGFGNNKASTDVGAVTDTSYFLTQADINAVNNAGTFNKNPSSIMVGIQAGHDWVWKQMVYGVAADYGAMPLESKSSVTMTYPDNSDQYSVYTSMSTNWLFTLRGRLGYQTLVQQWPTLFYLTGGMAMTQLKVNNSFSDTSAFAGTGGSNAAKNQIGWTAGAGIEVISFCHASIDLEYLYVQVPSVKTTSSITNTGGGFGIPLQSLTNPFSTTGEFHANLLRIGLNYRFDE